MRAWLITHMLKLVRLISDDQVGEIRFQKQDIIVFPKAGTTGILITGKTSK